MSLKSRVEFIGLVLLYCGLMPLGVWFGASALFAQADVRGPFLLMSPVLAGCVVTFVASFIKPDAPNHSVSHGDLEAEFNDIAERLGLPRFRVFAQPTELKEPKYPIEIDGQSIFVYLGSWQAWDGRHRSFLAAYILARQIGLESFVKRYQATATATAIVFCFLAALSLWSILLLHAVALLGAWYLAKVGEFERSTIADSLALGVSRDYEAARSFVSWHNRFYRGFGDRFARERLAALDREAKDLGIA